MKKLVIVCFMVLAFLPARSQNSGMLDPAFGNAGIVLAGDATKFEGAKSVAVQEDGRIVVAGSIDGLWSVTRYLSNGEIDSTWGTDGVISNPDPGNYHSGVPTAIAIQQDGKILVGGLNASYFVVWRYLPEGIPDSSFGTSGYVNFTCGYGQDMVTSMKLDAENNILIAGISWNDIGTLGYYGHTVLARLHPDGGMDTTFGVNGMVMTEFGYGESADQPECGIQSDGKIILSGKTKNGSLISIAVRRFLSDGSLDITFGNNGTTITDVTGYDEFSLGLAIQDDDKILVVGASINYCLDFKGSILIRYTSDGILDNTFNSVGYILALQYDSGIARSVALQADQKILVAKSINGGKMFIIERWETDGSPDNTFGDAGRTTTSFDALEAIVASMALQPDGKIILCGTLLQHSDNDIVLARYDICTVGISNHTGSEEMSIYPVPLKEEVSIFCPDLLLTAKPVLHVFNSDGKLLVNQAIEQVTTTLGVGDFPPGSYYFVLRTNNRSIVRKAIK